MNISELSKKTGLSIQTIRYYEKIGVIPKAHRWPDSGYRDFDNTYITLIHFIQNAKEAGFTLSEIYSLVDLLSDERRSCPKVASIIKDRLINVENKLKALKKIKQRLNRLKSICEKNRKNALCPTLKILKEN